jgi:iron(III) transport system permease protein
VGVSLAVLTPLGLIVYQSFLSAPFFSADAHPSLEAYRYVWSDPGFLRAFGTSVLVAAGMVVISVPTGSMIAFAMVRGDLPGRRWLEPFILIPIFLSPIVLAFGYVVAVGPVGFFSLWIKGIIGVVPWSVYSLASLVLIAGLSHVPHVYLYTSTALRTLNPELEEAARSIGAGPWRVALTVSLPLVWPAIVYGGALVFLLGFELFGLPLVLADPAGVQVLTTYLYKLTNLLGVPSYQLMAVVAITIVLISLPLVFTQRMLLDRAGRYVTVRGRGQAMRALPLGRWRWPAFALVIAWLGVTVLVPLSGVLLRSVVSSWGEGVRLTDVLTLSHFPELLRFPNLSRGVLNTLLIASIGGALAVAAYTGVALGAPRW